MASILVATLEAENAKLKEVLAKLEKKFHWKYGNYDIVNCRSCGALGSIDYATMKVMAEPCSPSCPFRQAKELTE